MTKTNPIHIQLIDHVVIRARNLDTMLNFYRDILGCVLERGPGELGLAQLRAGQSLIDLVDMQGELGRAGGQSPDHSAPNMDHLCLQIEPWEPEAIKDYLREHGIEPGKVEQRYGASGMGPSIYIQDPEGNTVELKG